MADTGFLIVEDDPAIARIVERIFSRHRPVRLLTTVREAREQLATPSGWLGLVVDIGLPDGSGLEVLELARARWPTLPALVLTGNVQPANINRAYALHAHFLCKPGTLEDFESFIRGALAREGLDDARVLAVIDALTGELKLTNREVEALTLLIADVRRVDFAKRLGVSENTAKSLIRGLLKKTDHANLDELGRAVFRRALAGGAAPRS